MSKAYNQITITDLTDGTSVSITSTSTTYAASASQTSTPTSWSVSIPTLTSTTPYLWSKTVVVYSDGNSTTTYSVSSTFDSITVGGRNLVPISYASTYGERLNTYEFSQTNSSTTEKYIYLSNIDNSDNRIILGNTYTMSAEIKTNGNVSSVDMFVYDKNIKSTSMHQIKESSLTTEYQKFTFTFTPKSVDGEDWSCFSVRFDNNSVITEGTDGILYVRNIKLERGNVATDWTAAPEDLLVKSTSTQYNISTSETSVVDEDSWMNDYNSAISVFREELEKEGSATQYYIWERSVNILNNGDIIYGEPTYGASITETTKTLAKFNILNDSINSTVSEIVTDTVSNYVPNSTYESQITSLTTSIDQKADGATLSTVQQTVTEQGDVLEQYGTYIKTGTDGLSISKDGSNTKTLYTEDGFQIETDGKIVAKAKSTGFGMTEAIISEDITSETAWKIIPDDNHLRFTKYKG